MRRFFTRIHPFLAIVLFWMAEPSSVARDYLYGGDLDSLEEYEKKRLFVGAGTLTHSLHKVSGSESGETRASGYSYFTLGVSYLMDLTDHFEWVPQFYFTPFGRPTRDQAADIKIAGFRFPVMLDLKYIELFAGPGMMFYMVNGNGGTVELDNGNSKSLFVRPNTTSVSELLTLDLGIVVPISLFRIELATFSMGLLSPRRSFGSYFQLSVGIF